jgi:hypothetical protein
MFGSQVSKTGTLQNFINVPFTGKEINIDVYFR